VNAASIAPQTDTVALPASQPSASASAGPAVGDSVSILREELAALRLELTSTRQQFASQQSAAQVAMMHAPQHMAFGAHGGGGQGYGHGGGGQGFGPHFVPHTGYGYHVGAMMAPSMWPSHAPAAPAALPPSARSSATAEDY
jgi:hypothetical protein